MARRSLERLKGEDFRWEQAENDEEAWKKFINWADMVHERPATIDRRKRNLLYASIYANAPMLGFGVNSYTRSAGQGRIALNATQNAVDSLVSKVCKNRPRPMFTTVEGDYELREKVENADKYVDGLFYQQDYYQSTYPGKVLDAALYGLGSAKTHKVDGECVVERAFPWTLLHDDRETLYGKPVRFGQRLYCDKQEVFDLWRKTGDEDSEWNTSLERAIEGGSKDDPDDFDRDETGDQIVQYEGWRLPTSKSPGGHIICIRGKILKREKYTDNELPFTFLRPETQSMGFYGIGLIEKVATVQAEINRMVRDIQMAMHLVAKPHWMVEASSNVLSTSLNNDIATIIKYSGAVPPTVYVPQAMSAEVYQHLQFLYRAIYEIMGISQLSAQSQKPAGLNSAVGIRTYLNVETERFNDFVRFAEESAAKDALKAAKVLGGISSPKEMISRGKQSIEKVNWKKLDLESIAVQVYPTSKLPDTPAGRREYALELAQYGVAKPDEIYEMLEWADTEAFAKRRLAGRRNVERDIAKMRKGEKVVRDAIGDHAMAFQMASDAYEEAKHDNLPPARLAIMRNYVKACRRLMDLGKAPALPPPIEPLPPGGPMPPGLPPPGGGEPMPVPAPPMNGAPAPLPAEVAA